MGRKKCRIYLTPYQPIKQKLFFQNQSVAVLQKHYGTELEYDDEIIRINKMKNNGIQYAFSATVWKYPSPEGMPTWHFVAFPVEMAKEIRANLQFLEEGWGRMKATAKIGATEWKTSIWFDTKHNTYILPLKAEIRKKENIEIDKEVAVSVWV
jgi:hypothetical protein